MKRSPFTTSWKESLTRPAIVEESFDETQRILHRLRSGVELDDAEFDRVYPSILRILSDLHWTPVSVAKKASKLLVQKPRSRILDVGSGCGKFCLIGALTTDGEFFGIEQRDYFAKFSKMLAHRHGVSDVSYIHGDLIDLNWDPFDAFYFYNPFYENVAPFYESISRGIQIDPLVRPSEERYKNYIDAVRNKLKTVKIGTRVVTYHGFGGKFPPGFNRVHRDSCETDDLELWVKETNR